MQRVDILKIIAAKEDSPSYSATLRFLRKNKPEEVKVFMQYFKKSFDAAVSENLDNPDKIALIESLQRSNLNPKEF